MKKNKAPLGGMLLVESKSMLPVLKIWATKLGQISLVEVNKKGEK